MRRQHSIDPDIFTCIRILSVCCFLSALALSLLAGDVDVSISDVVRILAGGAFAKTEDVFLHYTIWGIRLPRALASGIAGGVLSLSAAIIQVETGRKLLGPWIIGATPGAAFGAVCVSFVGGKLFMGAPMIAGVAVPLIVIAGTGLMEKWRCREKIAVAGFAFGGGLFGFTAAINMFWGGEVGKPFSELAGSFAKAGWFDVLPLLLSLCILLLVCIAQTPERRKGRISAVLAACVPAAITASRCGAMPMLGFMVPYILTRTARLSGPLLCFASFFFGGALSISVDMVCKVNGEVPAGLVTFLLGAPLFILGLVRRRRIISGK